MHGEHRAQAIPASRLNWTEATELASRLVDRLESAGAYSTDFMAVLLELAQMIGPVVEVGAGLSGLAPGIRGRRRPGR